MIPKFFTTAIAYSNSSLGKRPLRMLEALIVRASEKYSFNKIIFSIMPIKYPSTELVYTNNPFFTTTRSLLLLITKG